MGISTLSRQNEQAQAAQAFKTGCQPWITWLRVLRNGSVGLPNCVERCVPPAERSVQAMRHWFQTCQTSASGVGRMEENGGDRFHVENVEIQVRLAWDSGFMLGLRPDSFFQTGLQFVSTKSFVVRLKVLAFACCLLCAQWLGDSFSVAKTSRYLFDHQIYAHSALCQVAQEAFDVSFTLELRNVSLKHLPSPVPRLNNCQNI